jgi:tetratricopeptide (TPR) repeat protein
MLEADPLGAPPDDEEGADPAVEADDEAGDAPRARRGSRTDRERRRRRLAIEVVVRSKPWPEGLERTLWGIASDPRDDEELRFLAARSLAGKASIETRKAAAAWLGAPSEDVPALAIPFGDLAGRDATAAEAAALFQTLDRAISERYAAPPHVRAKDVGEEAYGLRVEGLAKAVALAKDPVSLDRLADLLFDPRLTGYAREARGLAALRSTRGGGALAPLGPAPKTPERMSHTGGGSEVAPVPDDVRHVVAALKAAPPVETGARVARAVADARAAGRLAAFDDVYLSWIASDLHHKKHGDFADAAAAVEDALARTLPAVGPASLSLYARVEWLQRGRRFEEAAAVQKEQVRAAAALGSPDADAAWVEHRALQDFLAGAAAATAGRSEEARDLFRSGVARAPSDPSLLNSAAWVRANAGFDLDAAAADARRAMALERRLDDEPSIDTIDTLAYVLVRQGKLAEARETIRPALERMPRTHAGGGEIYWHAAQAAAGLGLLHDASLFVYRALAFHEPTLEAWMRADPFLALVHPRMDALVLSARRERESGD